MSEKNVFSIRLKELRTSLNMTQVQFAEYVGSNQVTLSSYETGTTNPSLEVVKEIATKCNTSIDWLCGLTDKKNLSDNIITYSDLINVIMLLSKLPKTTVKLSLTKYSYEELGCADLDCTFTDKNIAEFYQEWQEISSACEKTPSGKKLYNIWLKDTLERFDFPIEE